MGDIAASENHYTPEFNKCQETVRTYPDLSAFCLRERLDLPYRLWLLLRPAGGGRGWLRLVDIYASSCGSRRQTRQWLAAGVGTFWTVDERGRYWLAGLGLLCERLGVKPMAAPVDIPTRDIESLARFRSALFASWFARKEEGVTISQAILAEVFGRTSRTLRNWASDGYVTAIPNLAQAAIPKPGDDLSHYPTGTLEAMGWGKTWFDDPHKKPNLVWLEHRNNERVLCWKIPSTYTTTLEVGPKTTLQHKAARRASDKMGAEANDRRYYRKDSTGHTLARAIERGGPVYLDLDIAHDHGGEHLWQRLA